MKLSLLPNTKIYRTVTKSAHRCCTQNFLLTKAHPSQLLEGAEVSSSLRKISVYMAESLIKQEVSVPYNPLGLRLSVQRNLADIS